MYVCVYVGVVGEMKMGIILCLERESNPHLGGTVSLLILTITYIQTDTVHTYRSTYTKWVQQLYNA